MLGSRIAKRTDSTEYTAVLDLVDLATRTAVHSVGRSRSHSGLSELSRPAGHVRVVRSPKLRFLVELCRIQQSQQNSVTAEI